MSDIVDRLQMAATVRPDLIHVQCDINGLLREAAEALLRNDESAPAPKGEGAF